MASGLWPAVSGAVAKQQAIDTVANNLANVNTPGFKKDQPSFREYMAETERAHAPDFMDIPRGPFQDKDFYPLDGRDQSFVVNAGTYTNFEQGALKVTQSPFDIAINGEGFFAVSTPNGIRYTKHGSFKVSREGILVTKEGHPVLSAKPGGLAESTDPSDPGSTVSGSGKENALFAARQINLTDVGRNFSIGPDGKIFSGGNQIAQLQVAEFKDLNVLRKQGNQLFVNTRPDALSAEPVKSLNSAT